MHNIDVHARGRNVFAARAPRRGVRRRFKCLVSALADDVARTKTPHSGFHRDGPREFMEGWYWRATMPDTGDSVAIMYSYEQGPQRSGHTGRVGVQLMGPGDTYIAQTSTDVSSFWADRNRLRLGACLKAAGNRRESTVPKRAVPEDVFCSNVAQGFQATETEHQGHIIDDPGSAPGRLRASVPYASWSFSVRPVFGWGSVGQQQLSTAGWLAALPVLEPHWQVLMAHGVANGYVQWGPGKRIELKDAPIYSEKNWGQGFPKKWAWAQCNTFAAHPELAVTAVCAIRTVLAQPVEETLGMLGIHYNGEFIELAPYKGPMSWEVAPWGSWRFCGKNERYEALLTARCQDSDGAVLRAPLGAQGLAPACKDTFAGDLRLQLWRVSGGSKVGEPILDATSTSAALEVGGGPWWDVWKDESKMNPGVAAAWRTPLDTAAGQLERLVPFEVPSRLKPPGY